VDRRTFLRSSLGALGAVGLTGLLARQAAYAASGTPISLVGNASGGGLYHPNLAPLARTPLLRLPVGSVKASGWLQEQLSLQLAGLNGQMDTVSHFLDLSATGWAVPSEVGWEEVPYWLRGYVDLGAITGDAHTVATTASWIDAILATQASDGFFGPTELRTSLGGGPDFWPYMPMMQAMRSYQEATGDSRIIPFMTAFYRYQSQQGPSAFNQSWASFRWATNLDSLWWLYNRTGDSFLLTLADTVHANGANYVDNLPTPHNVNLAQGFTEPAQYSLRSGGSTLLQASYQDYQLIMGTYGQFSGGGFAGDENCRPGYTDPRQGFETCGIVEFMQSHETLTRLTGDPTWADACELLAFNGLPAALDPQGKGTHYISSPNCVQLDDYAKTQGQFDDGFALQAYMTGIDQYRCCPHNYGQGWTYFTDTLWLATADNGLAAAMYAPCAVTADVGSGQSVTVTESTDYPFGDTVTLTVATGAAVAFPLYLRMPGWCSAPSVQVNGAAVTAQAGPSWASVNRTWSNGDTVTVTLPMRTEVTTWTANHDSVSISNGPLVYSLQVGENYLNMTGDATWPTWEVYPTSAWNQGLVLNASNPASSVTKSSTGATAANPFTQTGTPVQLTATAQAIANWGCDSQNVVSTLQPSPVASAEPAHSVTLIPMGAARLRITSFPVIGAGGRPWQLPATPTASYCWSGDTVDALNSGYKPASSDDQSHPRFTWWNHLGTAEWVQYSYTSPVTVSAAFVYWYDDTGSGQCRVPQSWTVQYLDSSGSWTTVSGASGYGTAADAFNTTTFNAVTTTQLRLAVQLRAGVSGGILQWNVTAAPAVVTAGAWYRVRNQNSGLVLGVAGMSTADSADVVQYADNGTADHLWQFTDTGNGWYHIANQNSGLLLAVNAMSQADSAPVQQYQDNGSADHLWALVDNGDGWYRIRNLNSGLVLGVAGMSTAASAQVVQFEDNGTADHLWQFV